MDDHWLSTRTHKFCDHCGDELAMIQPADVMAARPVTVELICPNCGCETRAELTVEQLFQSIYPHLRDISSRQAPQNDNALLPLEMPRFPSEPPPSGMLH